MFTLCNILQQFRYAESVSAKHFHTSAKANKGLDEVFLDLARSKPQIEDFIYVHCFDDLVELWLGMIERRGDKGVKPQAGSKQKLVLVDDAPAPAPKSGGCC